jgi:ribosomal protection tetracycline resistance protein
VKTLNLGIVAHVDAGKTSLTERLLYAAGVIGEIGRVDDGSTQTDTLALERQRGITIKSAVVSFAIGDVTVNLIDTPGHPDFIAEVERVLSVLDGAVLVVSAVEGVQAQTRVLMRTLRRLSIPTLIFVNKIDRGGAQYQQVLDRISGTLTPAIIPMGWAHGLGTRDAGFEPFGEDDTAFTAQLADLLADHDDEFLAAYVSDEAAVSYHRLRDELAAQARRGRAHPVFFGSAITGAGAESLTAGITELLPAAGGDADGPVSGAVFKVERGPAGEKIAYVRMFSGRIRVRDRLRFGAGRGQDAGRENGEGPERGAGQGQKVTAISVFRDGSAVRRASVAAGEIGKLWGLPGIRIGDTLGVPRTSPADHHFAPPTLETVVVPGRRADRGALHAALTQLAEQDPLINLRRDEVQQEMLVSLYGEVQKEVIQATLASDFGINAGFRGTTTLCIERPVGTGEAVDIGDTDPTPFLATVGLRIDPAPAGSGVRFRLEIELGALPFSFLKAIEETVHRTLRQGLHGWQVTDCVVTLTRSGYWPRQSHAHATFDKSMSSTAGDFRNVTPLVVMDALRQAATSVHEPVNRFRLEVPADVTGAILPVLARLRAVPRTSDPRGSLCTLEGEIPAAQVHGLEQQLPALTRGEGVLECAFGHYQPVRGAIPERPRTDHNPLNRQQYLLRVSRGVTGR